METDEVLYHCSPIGGLTVTATGGYTLIWCIDAALCILAACAFRVRLPAAE